MPNMKSTGTVSVVFTQLMKPWYDPPKTPAAIQPERRFVIGRLDRTFRTDRRCSVRDCPSESSTVTSPAVAEANRPLILRAPRGASSLYSTTTMRRPGCTARTADQSLLTVAIAGAPASSSMAAIQGSLGTLSVIPFKHVVAFSSPVSVPGPR